MIGVQSRPMKWAWLYPYHDKLASILCWEYRNQQEVSLKPGATPWTYLKCLIRMIKITIKKFLTRIDPWLVIVNQLPYFPLPLIKKLSHQISKNNLKGLSWNAKNNLLVRQNAKQRNASIGMFQPREWWNKSQSLSLALNFKEVPKRKTYLHTSPKCCKR